MQATIPASDMQPIAIAMKKAGIPIDQAERFISAGYVPLDGMLPFHKYAREADTFGGPEWIALGGKRGPGKSHTIMAQVALDDCMRVPNLKVLFLRKIKKSAAESFEDVIRRVFAFTPHTSNSEGVTLKNKSRMMIGGFKDESDIDKYLGIEYDAIVVEECTQISETKIQKLRGSLRTSKINFRPRIYLSTNADGIGLKWFKNKFIEPYRQGKERETRFLDVTSIRNPFVNVEYEAWLDSLTGPLGKAWRDGDWDAFAGMSFPEFNRERHVIKGFDIPNSWIKWKATDWGNASPFCTLWLTKNPDTSRVYAYREFYTAGLTDQAQARGIKEMSPPNETYFIHYADPSLWERKNQDGKVFSTADEYQKEGIRLTPADNARVPGKRKINNILADLPDGEPGLQIFENCPHLIDQLSSLAADQRNPEDVDTTQEDHCLVGETLVATSKGDVQIKDVRAGDEVLTRYGYRQVLKSWMTKQDAEVYKVTFTNGATITATPNHPVYVAGRGFIRVDTLRYGDIIMPKENTQWQKQLFSKASSLGDTLTRLISQAESISRQAETIASKVSASFIKKFGEVFTETFQTGITSTTKMGTLSTTTYQTLKQYQGESIYPNIQTRTHQQPSTWNRSGRSLLNGIGLRQAGHGTRNTPKMDGRKELHLSSHANNARRNTPLNSKERTTSARTNADQHGDASLEKTTRSELASFAIKNIQSIATHAQGLVQNFAVRVCDVQKLDKPQDVYNLTVNEHAEFFANGVLVHNSYDTLRYGLTNQRKIEQAAAPRQEFSHPLAGVPGL